MFSQSMSHQHYLNLHLPEIHTEKDGKLEREKCTLKTAAAWVKRKGLGCPWVSGVLKNGHLPVISALNITFIFLWICHTGQYALTNITACAMHGRAFPEFSVKDWLFHPSESSASIQKLRHKVSPTQTTGCHQYAVVSQLQWLGPSSQPDMPRL